MSKSLGPAMPLYWDDFIGGTTSFGANEIGAYFLLLGYQWANGSVENDAEAIQRIAREEYGKLHRVLRKFDVLPDGSLRNQRCHEVREARIAQMEKQRQNAILGGQATKAKFTPPAGPPATPPAGPPAGPPATPPATPPAGPPATQPAGPEVGPNKALPSPSPSPLPIPEKTKKKTSSSLRDDGFDVWWPHYPRKVGKIEARKVWSGLKDRPTPEEIIAALVRLKGSNQWRKDGGEYIPHASRWLRRGGWDDMPDAEVEAGHAPGSFEEDENQ